MRKLVQELVMFNIVLGLFEENDENKLLNAFRWILAIFSLVIAIISLVLSIGELCEVCNRNSIEE